MTDEWFVVEREVNFRCVNRVVLHGRRDVLRYIDMHIAFADLKSFDQDKVRAFAETQPLRPSVYHVCTQDWDNFMLHFPSGYKMPFVSITVSKLSSAPPRI